MKKPFLLATLLWLASFASLPVQAQALAAPPAGLSQEQFNALVDAISNSVTDKLKAQGTLAPPEAKPEAKPAASSSKGGKPPPGPKIIVTAPKDGPNAFAVFLEDAGRVLGATPVMLAASVRSRRCSTNAVPAAAAPAASSPCSRRSSSWRLRPRLPCAASCRRCVAGC